eukprot:403348138
MEGHPIKRLRQQKVEDLDEEIARFEKPCVKIVNMREEKKEDSKQIVKQEVISIQTQLPTLFPIKERDIIQTMVFASQDQTDQQVQQPKKKQSLFSQRLKAKNQQDPSIQQTTQQSSENTSTSQLTKSFPQAFKVDLNTQSQPIKTAKKSHNILEEVKIGDCDESTHQENIGKIKQMSKEEIQEQLEFLQSNFNPMLLEKLKKIGQKKPEKQSNDFERIEKKNQLENLSKLEENLSDNNPIEMNDIATQINTAAQYMEQKTDFLKTLRFNCDGQILFAKDHDQSTDARNINFIMSEDFEQLDKKYFSLHELESLLGSTDVLDANSTNIIKRVQLLLSMNQRADVSQKLLDVLKSLLEKVFLNHIHKKQQYEFVNMDTLWHTNLNISNINLNMLIDPKDQTTTDFIICDSKLFKTLLSSVSVDQILKKSNVLVDLFITSQDEAKSISNLISNLQLLEYLSMFSEEISKQLQQSLVIKSGVQFMKMLISLNLPDVLSHYLRFITSQMKYSKETCISFANSVVFNQDLKDLITSYSLKNYKNCELLVTREYIKTLNIIANYDYKLLNMGDFNLTLIEIVKFNHDTQLLCLIFGLLQTLAEEKELISQSIMPLVTIINDRSRQEEKLDKDQQLQFQNLYTFENLSSLQLNDAAFLPLAVQLIKDQMITLRNLDKVMCQVQLASLDPIKQFLFRLIDSGKLKRQQVFEILPYALTLLSKHDEYFLMMLFNDYLFNKNFLKNSLTDQDMNLLKSMYLSYCLSDDQTYKVSEPNYKNNRQPTDFDYKINQLMHEPDMKHEIMLPLLSDWLIKPLFYITKIDDQNIQKLCQTIFNFIDNCFSIYGEQYCQDLLGLSKDEILMLVTFLITDEQLSFNRYSQESMFYFVQRSYFKKTDQPLIFQIQKFTIPKISGYLSQSYSHIFLKDSFLGRIAKFVNERSIDENPIMIFILILTLQSHLDLDFRKSLLTEIQDVFLCLMRCEDEHLKVKFDSESFKLYLINKQDPLEYMYYAQLNEKIINSIREYPTKAKNQVMSSQLYNLIKFE